MSGRKIVIAIDGFSSCGKSTLARDLAAGLGYRFIDSGAMYRAVTLYALRNNLIVNGTVNTEGIIESLPAISIAFEYNPATLRSDTLLNGENIEQEIRRLDVSEFVSPVSAIREVRQSMVRQQQALGRAKAVVMDGRDIGTHVFPDAELKIFMTADPEIRAQRRYRELTDKGVNVTIDEIRQNIAHRDNYDQSRKESPLKKADDALILDNSNLTMEQQLEWALERASKLIGTNDN